MEPGFAQVFLLQKAKLERKRKRKHTVQRYGHANDRIRQGIGNNRLKCCRLIT